MAKLKNRRSKVYFIYTELSTSRQSRFDGTAAYEGKAGHIWMLLVRVCYSAACVGVGAGAAPNTAGYGKEHILHVCLFP